MLPLPEVRIEPGTSDSKFNTFCVCEKLDLITVQPLVIVT